MIHRARFAAFVGLATFAVGGLFIEPSIAGGPPPLHFTVDAAVFDPADTDLVQAVWLGGIGCPTNSPYAQATAANNYNPQKPTGTYTDPACPTGDPMDKNQNEGLLLVKTGPTDNNAAAGANINGLPKNFTLTELGYDIRKPGVAVNSMLTGDQNDPRGSHCGAGAPRFNIQTTVSFYFLGCNSPPPTTVIHGAGWLRLRWGGPLQAYDANNGFALVTVTGTVQYIQIMFDEGQDQGPDNSGAAILDNIDINGTLVGQGGGGAAH